MFGFKKIGKRTCTAVDIGSYSTKILEAEIEEGVYKLTNFAISEFSPNSQNSDLAANLKTTLDSIKLATKDIHISLVGPDAIVRIINMPDMNKQDLKNSLKYEADRYIPFGIEEVYLDSCILGKTKEGAGQMRVLLAAAKKDLINKRIKMFEDSGYNVKMIDISVFSVLNAFTFSEKSVKEDANIAVLNIGHKYTNIVICKGANPFFTRDIQIGGEYIANIVARQTGMPAKDVFLKSQDKQDAAASDMEDAVKTALVKLGDEIRLSFGYYENQFGASVDEAYISGGMANVKGLSEYFDENIGIKSVIWDPLKNFTVDEMIDKAKLSANKSSLAVACGLAIRNDI